MKRNRAKGLSLVEVLITTAICGTLMVAVGTAFQVTLVAVEQNERFFRASQTARVCITQIMAEARKCRSGAIDDTSFEMVTASGETRTYAFDATNKQLTMTIHVGTGTDPTYTLARNVQDVTFSSSDNSVAMSVNVAVGTQQITLTGSAIPRKTMQYH